MGLADTGSDGWHAALPEAPAHVAASEIDGRAAIRIRVVEDTTGPVTLVVAGELDLAAASALRVALHEQIDRDVVLDLQGVVFLDSTALGVILAAARRAAESGHRVMVCDPQPGPRRVLELTGVLDFLTSA